MGCNNDWPFHGSQVIGMKLHEYLDWAAAPDLEGKQQLLLPPIQRGFVWKPQQIVDLWDSLLRGMPIGSLMLSKLSSGQSGVAITSKTARETQSVGGQAMALLDGQQRTLAMLIGWPSSKKPAEDHCLWIDLAGTDHAHSRFDIHLTTRTQPFGFQRDHRGKLSRQERKDARVKYDENYPDEKQKPDYELFNPGDKPLPWKSLSKPSQCVALTKLWDQFRCCQGDASGKAKFKALSKTPDAMATREALYDAFARLNHLEIPLVLIPPHISEPPLNTTADGSSHPLVLLFERTGQNGSRLSPEDLLFSMIKQQWPKAQELVNHIYEKENQLSVRVFMNPTDYVMTAFRLAAAEIGDVEKKLTIADNPRPSPRDFHRHLEILLGEDGEEKGPLRRYLDENSKLVLAFKELFDVLQFKNDQDIGLPLFMMPHLSRGLIQVLLRWIMLNMDPTTIKASRQSIISFCLFWYVNMRDEDKASKKAFEIITKSKTCHFPSSVLYKALIDAPTEDEFGLALPLMQSDDIFAKDLSTSKQRELYNRFCLYRKPILLWLQRKYVHDAFNDSAQNNFSGRTDEDTVPYDYDHLCPQNHWASDWRTLVADKEESDLLKEFRGSRHWIGNCIGNLHVIDSSLNRSFGDEALTEKIKLGTANTNNWLPEHSLLFLSPDSEESWNAASSSTEDGKKWSKERVDAFKTSVFGRAEALYGQFYAVCKHMTLE